MPISQQISELQKLSARIGMRSELVQGAGGNTSIKQGSVLWVKASGKWLSQAEDEPIFVPLHLEGVQRHAAIDVDDAPLTAEVVPGHPGSGLKPSIETALHAVMPHRVVVHAHAVDVIALAVIANGQEYVRPRLEGLRWAWVPYRRPGQPLALAVGNALKQRPDILVLANHGVVVGAESCAEAEELLADVVRRLDCPARASSPTDLARLSRLASTHYRPAADAAVHALATDPVSLRIATGGSLYPDHVVFLGSGVAVLDGDSRELPDILGPSEPKLRLRPGVGALVHDSISRGGAEMLGCLAMVVPKIPADAAVSYLSAMDEDALLNWDAEVHRQALDADRPASPAR